MRADPLFSLSFSYVASCPDVSHLTIIFIIYIKSQESFAKCKCVLYVSSHQPHFVHLTSVVLPFLSLTEEYGNHKIQLPSFAFEFFDFQSSCIN